MKRWFWLSAVLAVSVSIATPGAIAHVGHGDEFQATGGVDRVEVNPQTDGLLGIQVTPIAAATDGGSAVRIPVTAVVDDNGRQLVFVQYENFYEPVPVTTGMTEGEWIEITAGLSVGEQLVTQGSLALYAESRKTQTADAATPDTATSDASPANSVTDSATNTATDPATNTATGSAPDSATAATTTPPVADAATAATTDDAVAQAPDATPDASGGVPMGLVAALGGGAAVLAIGAVTVLGGKTGGKTGGNQNGGV